MKKGFTYLLFASAVGVLAIATAGQAQSNPTLAGSANDGPPSPDVSGSKSAGIGDIVVTARRRAENLQSIPTAVTAFSANQLTTHGIKSIQDIGQLTPSLSVSPSPYGASSLFLSIRGQRANDIVLTQVPSIGVYIDDVYQPSAAGYSSISAEDASSVEVLKGPQGTLYGRNTTGGALKITTQLPDLDHYSGSIRLGAGNWGDVQGHATLNLPLIDGVLGIRVSGGYDRNSGYGHDLANNTDLGAINNRNIRGTLRFKPTDKLEIVLRGDTLRSYNSGPVYTLRAVIPGGPFNAVAAGQMGLNPASPADLATARNVLDQTYVNEPGFDRRYSAPTYSKVRQTTTSATLSYAFSREFTLRSVTSYLKSNIGNAGDNDGTPFYSVDGEFEVQRIHQVSEELQALGKLGDRLNYTVGYFFYRLRGAEPQNARVFGGPAAGGVQILNDSTIVDTSHSAYAQATYSLLSTVRLTGGVRYTSETNPITAFNQIETASGTSCNLPVADRINGQCAAHFGNSNSNWSYTASLDWNVTPLILLYAKTDRGFKAGGVNQRGDINGGFNTFRPEQVTDYEIGAKTEFLDRKVRLNLAAYYSDYTDIQRSIFIPSAGGAIETAIQNAASGHVKGVEAELTVRPVQQLTFNLGGSYTGARYGRYQGLDPNNPGQFLDLSKNVFAGIPKWQGNASVTYEQPVGFGSVLSTLDLAYQSNVNYSPDNNQPPSAAFPEGTAPYSSQGGYALLNGRVQFNIDAYDMYIAVWSRNLANKHYWAVAEDQSGALGFVRAIKGAPRSFGFEISKRF
jgi:iron complex outermembrane receptor protein